MSSMIDKISISYGVDCIRTKIGFKYVAPEMTLNKSILGGEESGGYSYSPHLNERDGTISALLLLEQLVDSNLNAEKLYANQKEKYGDHFFKRSDFKIDQNSKNKLTKFIKDFNSDNLFNLEIKSIDKKDGLKIILDENSWLLLRLSGTEPVARIYCESKNEKSTKDLILKFTNYIKI
jgi:phosphomannomutase